jgi:hypothetical protein
MYVEPAHGKNHVKTADSEFIGDGNVRMMVA